MRAMQPLFTGPPMDPQLVAEANAEVEASGGTVIFGEAYRRAVERRQQAQSEAWAEQGRERERKKEAAQAEERNRQREAAMERRRLGM
jgi:ornithine carbamoyltransferase